MEDPGNYPDFTISLEAELVLATVAKAEFVSGSLFLCRSCGFAAKACAATEAELVGTTAEAEFIGAAAKAELVTTRHHQLQLRLHLRQQHQRLQLRHRLLPERQWRCASDFP